MRGMSNVFQVLHVTKVFNFCRFGDFSDSLITQFKGPVYVHTIENDKHETRHIDFLVFVAEMG